MTPYRVFGTVCWQTVNTVVHALNGAEAIHAVLVGYYPRFGKDWQKERKEWVAANVRLNATQVDTTPTAH